MIIFVLATYVARKHGNIIIQVVVSELYFFQFNKNDNICSCYIYSK